MKLTDLPVELLYNIADKVGDIGDLCSLREVSRLFSTVCAPLAFREVTIIPYRVTVDAEGDAEFEPSENWLQIANDDALRFYVKYVIVSFYEYIRHPSELLDFFLLRFPAASQTVRSHFPNICSLNLRLPRRVRGSRRIKEQFEGAVQQMACTTESLTVSDLHLLDVTSEDRVMMDLNRLAPKNQKTTLRRLHLNFLRCLLDPLLVQHGTQHSYLAQERAWRRMPENLRNNWLAPNSTSLTHLSLYCRNYWGAFPRIDFTRLDFPNLKALALGNYCFAYPSQLESVLAMKTIESLLLDDCPILFLVRLNDWSIESLKIDTSHWRKLRSRLYDTWTEEGQYPVNAAIDESTDEIPAFTTTTSWKQYFDDIARELPRLCHFGFRPGQWSGRDGSTCAMEMHNQISVDWHPSSRYVAYDALQDHWLEVLSKDPKVADKFFRVDLDMELNYRIRRTFSDTILPCPPQVDARRIEADVEALDNLLKVVQARAKDRENCNS